MEQAMRRHFFHHGGDEYRGDLDDEKWNCHWCQIRAFATHKQYPITIVNTEDDSMIDPNFHFMEFSIRDENVEPTRHEFLTGCECKRDLDCQYNQCTCLQDVEEDESGDEDPDTTDEPSGEPVYEAWCRRQYGKKAYAYHSYGARAGHLRSKVLTSRNPIYECHESCVCSPDCFNRVVEKGRKLPLQIFRTKNRGWGVRSTVDIRKGQFVDKYMGEIITAEEANRRRAQSHMAQRKDVYLFALDKFSNPDSFDERLRGPPLEVDGEFKSGPTRFINHSCEPNLRIFARVGDHADKHIHDLAFFAVRDIPRGEELTFDYVDGVDDSDMDALDPEKQKDMARCLCGNDASSEPAAGPINSQPGQSAAADRPNGQNSTSHSQRARQPLSQHIDKPLRRHEWVSRDRDWTRADLDLQRTEFFDTRVTGRPEVWQVIHAALEVLWEADIRRAAGIEPIDDDGAGGLVTAQGILKAAEVTLPTGDLSNGVYDSLGNYYALPEWIVSDPTNVTVASGTQRGSIDHDGKGDDDLTGEDTTEEIDEDEALRRREEKGKAVVDIKNLIKVRARLSDTYPDVVISIDADESVRSLARKIAEESGLPSTRLVRVAYMGKILKENMSLQSQGWQKDHVVNALVFNR
ncbi:hypothetical protein RRF57_010189 [Xylaria bambusicola]|uniref:SET domain-containing protein n=1 Tax=Xylaria bambusicola TaxID=326684 RepID=A0AAN7ZCI3_9PEZI